MDLVFGFTQILIVNDNTDTASSYVPEELIKNIMISNPCSSVDNFSFRVNGTHSDLTMKSYSYFKRQIGGAFPFNEAVTLTTGSAFPAGNTPNSELIDNDNEDKDLEEALDLLEDSTQDATFIKFNFTPQVDVIDFRFIMASEEYGICLNKDDQVTNSVTQPFLPITTIETQLSATIYSFQWHKGSIEEVDFDPASFIIPGATSAVFSPNSEGTYSVLATNRATGCRILASAKVVSSYPLESVDVEILSPIFSDTNTLEVSVIGTGVYEYRVDFAPWQLETIFENILLGEHIIYVRDLLNCNEISQSKTGVGYPKFFTPNSDGYHDTWNIVGMTVKSSLKIYIFERYGKVLKIISLTEKGWDET